MAVTVAAQQLSPDHARCMNEGNAFSLDMQISGCTAVLQSDRASAANRAVSYYNRGNVYQAKGDSDRAIADYTVAIRLNPNFADAYGNRGAAYQAKSDNDRGIADATKAIEIDRDLRWPTPTVPAVLRASGTMTARHSLPNRPTP